MSQDQRQHTLLDRLLIEGDRVLRTLSRDTRPMHQASPAKAMEESELSDKERRHAGALMRINHTGEVCAQALYQGQALTAKLPEVRGEMQQAADEEIDHLAWCEERIHELGSHTSYLNPIFYGASFTLGAAAGAVSDKISLGFVAATEELVCKHLEDHQKQLPAEDRKSRAIVDQMIEDESRHQQTALEAGGARFPFPIKMGMKLASKVMTHSTYRL